MVDLPAVRDLCEAHHNKKRVFSVFKIKAYLTKLIEKMILNLFYAIFSLNSFWLKLNINVDFNCLLVLKQTLRLLPYFILKGENTLFPLSL